MDKEAAEILVQGMKDCFVRTPNSDISTISDINNVADCMALIAYAMRVMYISFGAGEMSLKEASDLKLEESLSQIGPALQELAYAMQGETSLGNPLSVADALRAIADNLPDD